MNKRTKGLCNDIIIRYADITNVAFVAERMELEIKDVLKTGISGSEFLQSLSGEISRLRKIIGSKENYSVTIRCSNRTTHEIGITQLNNVERGLTSLERDIKKFTTSAILKHTEKGKRLASLIE